MSGDPRTHCDYYDVPVLLPPVSDAARGLLVHSSNAVGTPAQPPSQVPECVSESRVCLCVYALLCVRVHVTDDHAGAAG